MLNSTEFKAYCQRTKLSAAAVDYITAVRSSPPSRRVGDNAKSFLKYLDNRALHIAEDNWIAKSKRRSLGYNPYDKPPKS